MCSIVTKPLLTHLRLLPTAAVYPSGNGYGDGYGIGNGIGNGRGDGYDYGDGDGDGYGYGYGDGSGYGTCSPHRGRRRQ